VLLIVGRADYARALLQYDGTVYRRRRGRACLDGGHTTSVPRKPGRLCAPRSRRVSRSTNRTVSSYRSAFLSPSQRRRRGGRHAQDTGRAREVFMGSVSRDGKRVAQAEGRAV